MQHDSNVKVCTEAKMQKTVHVHVEAVYCHQGAVWKTRWSKYCMRFWSHDNANKVFAVNKNWDLKTIQTLCFCQSLCFSWTLLWLSFLLQLFRTSHTCTQCVEMLCWCFSQHYASLSLQPLCRWNSHNPLCIAQHLCKVTPAQGHYSGFSASRFNALITLI